MSWDNYGNKPLVPLIQIDPSVSFDAAIAPYNVMFSDPNPDVEMLPWYNSTSDIVRNLPLQDPAQKAAIQKFCDALLNQNMGDINMSDLQGIDPTVIRLATSCVQKIRRQRTGNPSGISRSVAVCEALQANLRKSKVDPKGAEKDSAAAIRGAEIARQLKEKEDADKAPKNSQANKACDVLLANLLKSGGHYIKREGASGHYKYTYAENHDKTASGKQIPSLHNDAYKLDYDKTPSKPSELATHLKGWSQQDHEDAATFHTHAAAAHKVPHEDDDGTHADNARWHKDAAKMHRAAALLGSDGKGKPVDAMATGKTESGKTIPHPESETYDAKHGLADKKNGLQNTLKHFSGWSQKDHEDAVTAHWDAGEKTKSYRDAKAHKQAATIHRKAGDHMRVTAYAQQNASKGSQMNKACDVLRTNLAKAGKGEGTRGGSIIGHTKSGKPIYSATHPKYDEVHKHAGAMTSKEKYEAKVGAVNHSFPDYTAHDHYDAHMAHSANAGKDIHEMHKVEKEGGTPKPSKNVQASGAHAAAYHTKMMQTRH